METKESLDDYTVEGLKKKLKAKNLPQTGNKDELIERYLENQAAAADEPALELSAGVEELKDLLELGDETLECLKKNRYFKVDQLQTLAVEDLKELGLPLHDLKELTYYLYPELKQANQKKLTKEDSPSPSSIVGTPVKARLGSTRPIVTTRPASRTNAHGFGNRGVRYGRQIQSFRGSGAFHGGQQASNYYQPAPYNVPNRGQSHYPCFDWNDGYCSKSAHNCDYSHVCRFCKDASHNWSHCKPRQQAMQNARQNGRGGRQGPNAY